MGRTGYHMNYLLLFIVVYSFTHFFPWRIISAFNIFSRKKNDFPEIENSKSNIKSFLNPYDKFALEKRVCQERRIETISLSMRLLHMKFEKISDDMIFKVKKMDQAKLDLFITKIVESKNIEEINVFTNQN